jgi:hypothetical protein
MFTTRFSVFINYDSFAYLKRSLAFIACDVYPLDIAFNYNFGKCRLINNYFSKAVVNYYMSDVFSIHSKVMMLCARRLSKLY